MNTFKNIKYLFPLLLICFISCTNKKPAKKNITLTKINHDDFKRIHPNFKISSIAIENGVLKDAYKCEEKVNDVENSIPLSWQNVPNGTKSLAIVMYHYPKKDDKTEINSYLLLWNIDPKITEIPYKMASKGSWFMGANKDGTAVSYTSPCSRGKGTHKYIIALYALSKTPDNLPKSNSLNVDYNVFMDAIATVDIIDRTTLEFISAN
ncbi:hypothetical protein MHL31_03125 [Lutibacter sp. A80]|uniref:YbhB/YbcL family Raf kinase inhibitor-like protein n=1 Tax=Lutibacter sp. A80 TaxID=2918453 RepID=UPI001F05816D|nr:hypothetical protein [Lutibacter sp. A80]UMB61203.1 hypothetical protein MHL31_03125 [Lutibacter sp. A80]